MHTWQKEDGENYTKLDMGSKAGMLNNCIKHVIETIGDSLRGADRYEVSVWLSCIQV